MNHGIISGTYYIQGALGRKEISQLSIIAEIRNLVEGIVFLDDLSVWINDVDLSLPVFGFYGESN